MILLTGTATEIFVPSEFSGKKGQALRAFPSKYSTMSFIPMQIFDNVLPENAFPYDFTPEICTFLRPNGKRWIFPIKRNSSSTKKVPKAHDVQLFFACNSRFRNSSKKCIQKYNTPRVVEGRRRHNLEHSNAHIQASLKTGS